MLMPRLLLLLLLLGLPPVGASGQPAARQPQRPAVHYRYTRRTTPCGARPVTLTYYDKLLGDSIIESGIVVRHSRIESRVNIYNDNYEFSFGRFNTRSAPYDFYCSTNQVGKPFNGHYQGYRTGIWFRYYPWGGIRKIISYTYSVSSDFDSGRVHTVTYVRPNGRLRRVVHYRDGKPLFWGYFLYNKEGYCTNYPPP